MRILTSLFLCLLLAGCVFDRGTVKYKFVSSGMNVDDALVVTQALLGNSLRPLAPVNLRGTRNATGDLLIEWTRRARLGAGMIPGSDVPLGEESDSFLVEIYSGATLLRTIPVAPAATQSVFWRATNQYAVITSNTLATTGSELGTAEAIQQITRTGSFYEFTIKKGTSSTFIISDLNWIASDGYLRGVSVTVGSSSLTINSLRRSHDFFESVAVKSSVAYSDGDRFRFVISGTEIRLYLNYTALGSVPTYISPLSPSFPITLTGWVGAAGAELQSAVIYNGAPSTIYSAAQQVQDFGSTQSSISLRVYQVSAVVGRGGFVAGTL